MMKDWNPDLYMQFRSERTQPSIDLIDKINSTAISDRWKKKTEKVSDLFTIHNYSFYYDHLSVLFSSIEMWETHYFHILDSHLSILKMMRSTGLKPYLNKLDNDLANNIYLLKMRWLAVINKVTSGGAALHVRQKWMKNAYDRLRHQDSFWRRRRTRSAWIIQGFMYE